MINVKALTIATLAAALFCCAHPAPAQVSINIGGPAPVRPYGVLRLRAV